MRCGLPSQLTILLLALLDFNAQERTVLPNVLADATDAIEQIASDGLVAAQLRFHTAAD